MDHPQSEGLRYRGARVEDYNRFGDNTGLTTSDDDDHNDQSSNWLSDLEFDNSDEKAVEKALRQGSPVIPLRSDHATTSDHWPGEDSEGQPPMTEQVQEEKQCRICFGGVDDEAEMGRLFRPCKCKGSMRFVHVNCLNEWRKASASRQSFWACDQCGYSYSLARTKFASIAGSNGLLASTTIAFFVALVFLSSFVVSYFVPDLDPSTTTDYLNNVVDENAGAQSIWSSWSIGSPSLDYVRMAVYAAADAFQMDEEGGIKFDWKATPKEKPRTVKAKHAKKNTQGEPQKPYEIPHSSRKHKAPKAAESSDSEPPSSSDNTQSKTTEPPSDGETSLSPLAAIVVAILSWRNRLLIRLAHRFTIGMSFVGMLSFVNLLINMAFLSPFQLRRGFGGAQRRGDRSNIGTIIIIMFVAIGIARAVYQIYKLNRWFARIILARAETGILEVGEDVEDEQENNSIFSLEKWKKDAKRLSDTMARRWRNLMHDPQEPPYRKILRWISGLGTFMVGRVARFWFGV